LKPTANAAIETASRIKIHHFPIRIICKTTLIDATDTLYHSLRIREIAMILCLKGILPRTLWRTVMELLKLILLVQLKSQKLI
jgi:hypothetical protein